MKRAIRQILLLAVLVAAFPASATAGPADDAAIDCIQDGSVDGSYSDSVLRQAIGVIRSRGDSSVYGDCEAVLASMIGSGGGPKANAAGNGGPGADDENLTLAEKRAKEQREQARKRRQLASLDDVAGGPAADPLQIDDSADDGMPLPLLLAVIVLALLAAGGGVWYAARRNPGLANALRRVPLPGRRS
jgi:hypothetical protein